MKKMKTKMPLSIIILLTLTAALAIVSFLAPYLYPIDLGETSLTERLAMPSIFCISDSDSCNRNLRRHLNNRKERIHSRKSV